MDSDENTMHVEDASKAYDFRKLIEWLEKVKEWTQMRHEEAHLSPYFSKPIHRYTLQPYYETMISLIKKIPRDKLKIREMADHLAQLERDAASPKQWTHKSVMDALHAELARVIQHEYEDDSRRILLMTQAFLAAMSEGTPPDAEAEVVSAKAEGSLLWQQAYWELKDMEMGIQAGLQDRDEHD